MIDLDVIPDANKIDMYDENANGALIAQLIIFYIGIIAFVLVCFIPPFTLFLPYVIPVIILIVMFVNLTYFVKFLDRAGKKFETLMQNFNPEFKIPNLLPKAEDPEVNINISDNNGNNNT